MEVECWVERQHVYTQLRVHRVWGRKLSWRAKDREPPKEEPELSMWVEISHKRGAKTEGSVDSEGKRDWTSACSDGKACQLLRKTIIFSSHLTVYPLSTLAQLMRVGLGRTFLSSGDQAPYWDTSDDSASLWRKQMKLERVLWEPDH